MATDIVGGIRQAIADFVAPDLREMKGQFEAMSARVDAVEKALAARIDGVEKALSAHIDGLEQSMKTQFDGVNQKLDMILKFQSLETRLGAVEQALKQEHSSQ